MTRTLANGAEVDENGFISELVKIDLSDAIDRDLDSFLDFLSYEAAGDGMLMDISWEIEGVEDGATLILRVTGVADECE